MDIKHTLKPKFLYLAIGISLAVYVIIRGFTVGVTYDEAASIHYFNFDDFGVRLLTSSNTHMLNTIWIAITSIFHLDSLFLIRLPSILSFLLYLYFSYRIVANLGAAYFGVGYFILLCANPFLLEFFSLARGYAVSIALMMGGVFWGLEAIRSYNGKDALRSLAISAVSVLSIYSMIYFWVSLYLILMFLFWVGARKEVFKEVFVKCSAVGLVLCVLFVPIVSVLAFSGELYYGGTRDLYRDTILSLTKYTLYDIDSMLVYYFASASFLFVFSLCFIASLLNNFKLASDKFFIFAVVALIFMITVIAHCAFGVRYPIGRVALFLFPLIMLSFAFFLNELRSAWSRSILFFISIGLLFNLLLSMNFDRSISWIFDAKTEEIINKINEQGERMGRPANLACYFDFASSFSYYANRGHYPFVYLIPHEGHEVPFKADFYVARSISAGRDSPIDKVNNSLALYDKRVLLEYPDEGIIVFSDLKRKVPITSDPAHE